jgi:hypothetical protein
MPIVLMKVLRDDSEVGIAVCLAPWLNDVQTTMSTLSEEDVEPGQETPEEPIVPLQRSLFTEVYLSIFMLFARLGADDSMGGTPFNGVAGITFVQGFLGASVLTWAEILGGRRGFLEGYVFVILLMFIGLYFINSHILLDRGTALRFWYDFHSFSKRKRTALLWGAAAIVAVTVLIFYVTVATYHRVFAIDPYFDF